MTVDGQPSDSTTPPPSPAIESPPTIPVWVPPLDTGQPNAQDLNDLGTLPKANFAAANQIIPLTYGRDRLFGQPFVVHVDDTAGYLYTAYSFCEGQIAGYEQTIIDSDDALASGVAFEGLKNRGFETNDKFGWDLETPQDGTVSGTESHSGDFSMRINSLAGGPNQFSNRLKAPPADTAMIIRGWAMRDPLALPDADCAIGISDATTVGGALSGTSGITGTNTADSATAGWQFIEFTYTVPTGVVEYVFDLGESAGTTGGWYFDDLSAHIFDTTNTSKEVGIEIVPYVGSQSQRFDSLLNLALMGYVDDLPGLAYMVMRSPADSTRGFPRLEAIVQGREVYDPRLDDTRTDIDPVGSGDHREGDSTTWEFSQNPTICFRDMVINYTGWTILDQGVVDNAELNDELVSGVARREIGLTLARANTVESWVKGFRTYMGAFLNWEAGKIRVIPNRPDVEAPGAVKCDGTAGTWVDMGDQAVLDMGSTQDFTVECVFKMGSTTGVTQCLISKKAGLGSATAGYTIYVDTADRLVGRIHDGTTNAEDRDATTDFFDNEWHHAGVVIDQGANELILVVDGTARTPIDITSVANTLANAEEFRIGANGAGTERGDVLIDEVRVWDDVRTPAEITANIVQEITDPTADASLVGYWKMNDNVASSTAVDASASGNDGTLAGNAVFVSGDQQVIPDGVAMHITSDDILASSLNLRRRSMRSVPNSVAIDYEDSSGTRWFTARTQADSPRVTAGDEARRLSRVSLPGIHNASQAQREAVERLNWYLTDLDCTLTLFDEGWQLTHGSIVAVTHPIGLDAKLFRVRQSTAKSGRWTLDLTEYDPAIYSDVVIADPTIPDTNLGDPLNPPTVNNLVIAEELFNYKTGTTGSRVRITFDATNFPFLSQYLVEGYVAGAKVWQTTTGANNIVTPGVEEIVDTLGTPTDYEVRVYVQSPFASGTPAIENVQIDGKFAIPGDPTGAIITQTFADGIDLTWVAAVDIDIWRYEVRRGTTSDSWATATSLSFVDGLAFSDTGLAIGTHRYFIKAIDSVKQESANAAQVDVTLTAPTAVAGLFGFEVASEVRLNWLAVTGEFVERYRIAYSDIPETFETTLDIVDTIRFQTKDVPEGTFTFKAYSQDKAGNEAATAATIDIEVTSDADAFLADTYNFTQSTSEHANGSLTNMVEWDVRLDNLKYYVTNMADSFAVTPTDFIAAVPLANYHSTGASEWLSETKDFGLLLTGSWNLTHDTISLLGVFDIVLELSSDDATYVAFGGSAKGEFRYARVRISTLASPGTATAFVKSPVMALKINVVPLEESGEATSSSTAGVGKTINLSREYTALKEIQTQPKNTIASGSAVTSIVDNIVIGPNTGVKNNTTRYLSGGDENALDMDATQDFSVECLMKHSGGSQAFKVVVGKRSGSLAGWAIQFDESTENVLFVIDDGTNEVTPTLIDAVPDDGQWHHIAFTVDRTGDLIRGYVDTVEDTGSGSPFTSVSVTGSLENGNSFNILAAPGGGSLWQNGSIDQVRVWDDIRTAGEIAANAQLALDMTVTQANLIAYWLMDGDVGTNVVTLTDETANAIVVTATGAGEAVFVDPGSAGNTVQKINSFDVYIFDTFGQQLAEQFQYKWKAV